MTDEEAYRPVLTNGYGEEFDPDPLMKRLKKNGSDEEVWQEIWSELHHQGDIGTASYAALVEMAGMIANTDESDWRILGYAATIEECMHENQGNPEVPDWMKEQFEGARRSMFDCAIVTLRSSKNHQILKNTFAFLAFYRGLPTLGRFALATDDEAEEILGNYYGK